MKKKIIILVILIMIVILVCLLELRTTTNEDTANNTTTNTQIEEIVEITDVDSFYMNEITKDYVSIEDLDEDYTIEQAISDNAFVIVNAKVYNDNLYEEFNEKYENNEDAYIRVVHSTTEGAAIIYDVMYDSVSDKVYIVTDNTRDTFSKESDRGITFNTYEKLAEYEYSNLYWVAYNGELDDETFLTDSVFTIAVIN